MPPPHGKREDAVPMTAGVRGRDGVALAAPPFLVAVGLIAGAIIAAQVGLMRLFSVANWAHFGSLVISIAMFGFGVASAVMCVAKGHVERHAWGWARTALVAFGPLLVVANSLAQEAQFNPIFLIADPRQALLLFANFALYFVPFLAGAVFLGAAFLMASTRFQRVYFADMTGSGLAGLAILAGLSLLGPERLLLVPLLLWALGGTVWFVAGGDRRGLLALGVAAVAAGAALVMLPQLQVSPYKGVSYARSFPDSERLHAASGLHGFLEVFRSSYFHFAPGLSDMASLSGSDMPVDSYLGLYIDSDGPIGVMKSLPPESTGYFRYLPMVMPYLVKPAADVFVVQFGGGISTRVALASGARSVTVAEGNPMVLEALAVPSIREVTGGVLDNPKVQVVALDGRLAVNGVRDRYDVVDLSLADSTGLSSPGGFTVTEKFGYAREAMVNYMRALKPGGVLAVTVWNKEDPPKSVPKLLATMVEAAREVGGDEAARSLHVTHTFLSTLTVLFKRGGFDDDEIGVLDRHAEAMAFDVVYRPGARWQGNDVAMMDGFRRVVLGDGGAGGVVGDGEAAGEGETEVDMTATALYRFMMDRLVHEGYAGLAGRYVFDTAPLTYDRPYFAGYLSFWTLAGLLDRLEVIADEWGYLLLWATLIQGVVFGAVLLTVPVAFGWRVFFARQAGKWGTLLYFLCLGLGYIVVEVGMIGKFLLVLANPTASTTLLIAGLLVFTGLGALASERIIDRCRTVMPVIFAAIAAILASYAVVLDPLLALIGTWPYLAKIGVCVAVLAPPAFLMGFPFATAMTMLARLGKPHFFLWAWGINGLFSVVGAVLVPLLAVRYGLSSSLLVAAACYALALPAFFAVLAPVQGAGPGAEAAG